jgi:predicted NUDIX family phosphoesterase
MPVVADEQVLVVPTSRFRELGYFQGFSTELDRYLPALLEGDHLSYRPRGKMEEDPSFKQLIPYVVFQYTDAHGSPHLFQYTRGKGQGEARLRTKRSIGIGGHISTMDASAGTHEDVYREGMLRELAEEVQIDAAYREHCVGLINDDETAVGAVHLGVVHVFHLEQPAVTAREEDILEAGFRPAGELVDDLEGFESWSQIALKALFGDATA